MRSYTQILCIVGIITGISLISCSSKDVAKNPSAVETRNYENAPTADLKGIWPLVDGSESAQISQAILGTKIPVSFGEDFSGYHGSFLMHDAANRRTFFVLDFTTEGKFFVLLTEKISQSDLVILDFRRATRIQGYTMISTSGKLGDHQIDHLLVIAPGDTAGDIIKNPTAVFGFDTAVGKIIDMQDQGLEIYLESGD